MIIMAFSSSEVFPGTTDTHHSVKPVPAAHSSFRELTPVLFLGLRHVPFVFVDLVMLFFQSCFSVQDLVRDQALCLLSLVCFNLEHSYQLSLL